MPAKSKKQYLFMQAVAHGMKPRDSDLSQEQAEEYVSGQGHKSYKKLPKSVKKNDFPLIGGEKSTLARFEAHGRRLAGTKTPTTTAPTKKPAFDYHAARQSAGLKPRLGMALKSITFTPSEVDAIAKYSESNPPMLGDAMALMSAMVKATLNWIVFATDGMVVGEVRSVMLPVQGCKLKLRKLESGKYSGWVAEKNGEVPCKFETLSIPEIAVKLMDLYEIHRGNTDLVNKIYKSYTEEPDVTLLKGRVEEIMVDIRNPSLDPVKKGNLSWELETITDVLSLQKAEKIDKFVEIPDNKPVDPTELKKPLKKKVDQVTVKKCGDLEVCPDCGSEDCKCFTYLSKPLAKALGGNKFTLSFEEDWGDLDKENFLKAMKYVISQKKDLMENIRLFEHQLSLTNTIIKSLSVIDNICKTSEGFGGNEAAMGSVPTMNGNSGTKEAIAKEKAVKRKKEIKLMHKSSEKSFDKQLADIIKEIKNKRYTSHLEKSGKSTFSDKQIGELKAIKHKMRSGFHKPIQTEAPKKGKGSKYNRAQQKATRQKESE